jgi:hypothetical protein
MDELASAARLEADSETTEAADLMLSEAFSATPGSLPTTDDDAAAEKLLMLLLATEATLSAFP